VSNLELKAMVLHAPNAAVEADGVAQINVLKISNSKCTKASPECFCINTSIEDLLSSTNKFIARSSLSLKRQMNELTTTFEDYKSLSDEQHRHTDEKLTHLLEVVGRLVPAEDQLSDYVPS
jgi:flagellar capping protein FliD